MLDGLPHSYFFLSFLTSLLHSPNFITSTAVLQISDHYSGSSFSSTLPCRRLFTQTTAKMLKLAGIVFVSAMLTQAMALASSNPASFGLPQNARVRKGIFLSIRLLPEMLFVSTSQFDNDPGIPAVAVGPIGIYLDILWKDMALVETSYPTTQDLPGVVPNSPPNCASVGPGVTATLQGTAEMSAVYDDSTISNFTLGSFFFGCILGTEESENSAPMSCTLSLTRFGSSGKKVAQQDFPFVADGVQQQMIEAYPKGFTQVQYITFIIQAPNTTIVALIDSVSYNVFSK